MQPLCSPETPSSAPLPPPFVLSWDPGDVAQLPCSALIEVVLQKRIDIASLCRMHQDTKKCEIDDKLTEQSRFVEFAWESVTEALRDKTCLRSPFVLSAGAHQTVFPKATFSQQPGQTRTLEPRQLLRCQGYARAKLRPSVAAFWGCKGGPPATQGGFDSSNFTPQGTVCLLVVCCLLL